ncbi:hypothetical protein [Halosimplex halobium]|uniref:hypothetical protein n=1 Tax=Halosimplex halobium TaxID=3396618 RepID=UPI003F548DA5
MTEHPSAVGTVWVADDGEAIKLYTNKKDAEQDIFNACLAAVNDESKIDIHDNPGGGVIINAPDISSIYIDEIEVYGNSNAATFLERLNEPAEESVLAAEEDSEHTQ